MAQSKVRIKFRRGAFREIRTSERMLQEIQSRADRIAAACGRGFAATKAEPTKGRGRARAAVVTVTANAAKRNAREHTLMRNISAGKD